METSSTWQVKTCWRHRWTEPDQLQSDQHRQQSEHSNANQATARLKHQRKSKFWRGLNFDKKPLPLCFSRHIRAELMAAGRGTHSSSGGTQLQHSLQHTPEAGELHRAPDTAQVRDRWGWNEGLPQPSLPQVPSLKWGTKFLQIISVRIRAQVRVGTEMLSLTKKHVGLFTPW